MSVVDSLYKVHFRNNKLWDVKDGKKIQIIIYDLVTAKRVASIKKVLYTFL